MKEKRIDDTERAMTPEGVLYVDVVGGSDHSLLTFMRNLAEYSGKHYLFKILHIIEDRMLDLDDSDERVGSIASRTK